MTQADTSPPVRSHPRITGASLFELLGSMRFAIYLLVIICVASIIGTVLPQNQPETNYIDRFGPFWFEVLSKFSVWSIYNSAWFLVIMAFLVISTSICLIRNTPKMIHEMRSFREQVRGSSLRAFRHRVDLSTERGLGSCDQAVRKWLQSQGYRFKVRQEDSGVMIAAKKGSGNRLGYIFAHASIVIICIGGLLDSELPVRVQVWLMGKTPIVENMLIADVPPEGRLALSNPSYRANLLIPEGATRSNAIVNVGEGALVQPLPFELTLNKFIIDYYSTGMPSRFASEVTVLDPATGETFDQTIEVNEPLRFKGVTVYQSSFDDGGSQVELALYPLSGNVSDPLEFTKRVGESIDVPTGQTGNVRLEVTGLRTINVEDISSGDPQPRRMADHVAAVTGSAAARRNDNLRNIGPSVEFRLIDASGQATRYHNYMLPVELDGAFVFLAGVDRGDGQFSFLRIPVDENNSPREFMKLRAALADPAMRELAATRFAMANAADTADQKALQISAQRALETFAAGGLQALSQFLEKNVPEAELPRAAQVIVRLLGSSIASLRDLTREREAMSALDQTEPANIQWNQMAVAALSDLQFYPAPALVTMTSFDHLQASVFQVSRAPGMLTVYLGCLLLTIGVFAMFYVRDRRIWVWLRSNGDGRKTDVLAAMTSQKRTLDFNREFERFKLAISRLDQKEN